MQMQVVSPLFASPLSPTATPACATPPDGTPAWILGTGGYVATLDGSHLHLNYDCDAGCARCGKQFDATLDNVEDCHSFTPSASSTTQWTASVLNFSRGECLGGRDVPPLAPDDIILMKPLVSGTNCSAEMSPSGFVNLGHDGECTPCGSSYGAAGGEYCTASPIQGNTRSIMANAKLGCSDDACSTGCTESYLLFGECTAIDGNTSSFGTARLMLAQNLAWNASCANTSLSTMLIIVLASVGVLAALGLAGLLFWLWRTERIPTSFNLDVFALIPTLACPTAKIEVKVSELNPTAQRVLMAYLILCALMVVSGGMLFVDDLNPFLIQLDRLDTNVQFSQAYDDSATRALLLSSSAKWLIPLLPIGVAMLHMASLSFGVSLNGVKIFGSSREGITRATANTAATLLFEAGAVFFLLSFALWGDFKSSLIPRPASGEDSLADERVFNFLSEGVSGVLIVQCFDALLK